MQIELSLVKNRSIYSTIFDLVARTRYQVENDSDFLGGVIKFISDNLDIISANVQNKELIDKLRLMKNLPMEDFMCLKYILAENGLDILYWAVADKEVNEMEIPSGIVEYNILDETYGVTGHTRLASKINVSNETENLFNVYIKMNDMFNLFSSPLFEGCGNPIVRDIESLRITQKMTGELIPQITNHLNSVLEYLGKRIYVIYSR